MMEEMVRMALVGTSRSAAAVLDDAAHPCDALIAKLDGEDREHILLLRAGVHSIFRQCGQVAATGTESPEACPDESRASAGGTLAELLRRVMSPDVFDLLVDFLAQLDAAGLVLPPELLPQALDINDVKVREMLLPVLGERGQWLSRFNPDWNWVTTDASSLSGRDREALVRQWDEATFQERCRAVGALRRSSPSEARRLIESAIDGEKPEYRVRLIESLLVGLGPEDESFLESRLDDRAEQVRRAAAALLAQLPGSALGQRMCDRADAMLASEGSFGRLKRLRCTPPEEIDRAWTRDGVPAKPPSGQGKRACWAEAVLRCVPPSRWSDRFGAEPTRLIKIVVDDDYAESVLGGWTLAASAFARVDPASAAWLAPLWDYWAGKLESEGDKSPPGTVEHLRTLLLAMSGAEAEAAMTVKLASTKEADGLVALRLLSLVPRPWSPRFGRAYLAAVRRALHRRPDSTTPQWIGTLATAARAVPSDVFADAMTPWKLFEKGKDTGFSDAVQREIDKFLETVHLRQSYCAELAAAAARADQPAAS